MGSPLLAANAPDVARRSVTIPKAIASRLEAIAKTRHVSVNRLIIDLMQDGILAYDQRRDTFLQLADRFQKSTDPAETERLRQELEEMTFGG